MVQQVNLANESQYKGVTNSFGKLARQSKSQVRGWNVSTAQRYPASRWAAAGVEVLVSRQHPYPLSPAPEQLQEMPLPAWRSCVQSSKARRHAGCTKCLHSLLAAQFACSNLLPLLPFTSCGGRCGSRMVELNTDIFLGGVCYMDICAKQQWHCPPGSSRVNLISCDPPRWFAPPTPG
jgi:hypothetical protein